METKICSRCKLDKDISEFNKNPDRKCGIKPECKDCRKLVVDEYRRKNREKLNEKNRLYRLKVKDPNYVSVPKV